MFDVPAREFLAFHEAGHAVMAFFSAARSTASAFGEYTASADMLTMGTRSHC